MPWLWFWLDFDLGLILILGLNGHAVPLGDLFLEEMLLVPDKILMDVLLLAVFLVLDLYLIRKGVVRDVVSPVEGAQHHAALVVLLRGVLLAGEVGAGLAGLLWGVFGVHVRRCVCSCGVLYIW